MDDRLSSALPGSEVSLSGDGPTGASVHIHAATAPIHTREWWYLTREGERGLLRTVSSIKEIERRVNELVEAVEPL